VNFWNGSAGQVSWDGQLNSLSVPPLRSLIRWNAKIQPHGSNARDLNSNLTSSPGLGMASVKPATRSGRVPALASMNYSRDHPSPGRRDLVQAPTSLRSYDGSSHRWSSGPRTPASSDPMALWNSMQRTKGSVAAVSGATHRTRRSSDLAAALCHHACWPTSARSRRVADGQPPQRGARLEAELVTPTVSQDGDGVSGPAPARVRFAANERGEKNLAIPTHGSAA